MQDCATFRSESIPMLECGMLTNSKIVKGEKFSMKEISTSLIIDEAIHKLHHAKSGKSARMIVKQLYAVRAYCDLLIKTYERDTKPQAQPSKPNVTKQTLVSNLLDDDDDSIFDF